MILRNLLIHSQELIITRALNDVRIIMIHVIFRVLYAFVGSPIFTDDCLATVPTLSTTKTIGGTLA